ncbi:MAG: hypothetical protein IKJ75_00010 [Clostridia bacterium]|nr:hypothetical protein [Clostridia bacterium]
MKKFISKNSIIITSVILLLAVAVVATLAYVFTETDPVENTFKPSKVSCAVVENNGTLVTDSVTNTGNVKENVQIQNTGDTDAYIRVAVTVNWMNADGTRVWAQKPIQNTDYTITYNLSEDGEDGWFDGGDGFYYFSKAVSPNNLTEILISNAALMSGVTAPVGTDNTQYYLSIEIVASAIQSTPASTVSDQWGVTVSDDGTISKKGGRLQ